MKNTGTEYMSTERTPTARPDFAELLPPLSDEQLSLLEADILKNGCYAPVIVNEDLVIVDGHNRASICEKYGIPYRMTVFSFEDDLEAKQWALDTQKSRRNLTINELCKIALKLRPDVEARADKRRSDNGGDKCSDSFKAEMTPVSSPLSEEKSSVRKELAQAVGVGEVTMGRAMKIEDEAPQPVKDAVDSGDLTIAQGYNLTKELQEQELPEDEQEQAAREAVEREIARKNESRRRKIDESTRIAKGFCTAFEKALQIDPSPENIRTWLEECSITSEQLDNTIEEARQIADSFSTIADYLESTIKTEDRRHDTDGEEADADADTAEYAEENPGDCKA